MRLSTSYIPTQKEIPADAIVPSHQLMIRAGLIRPLAAGIYSYLPMGWRIMRKIMDIIRQEMDAIGGQELQLPAINPVEIWDETGRSEDFGEILFRLKDQKSRTLVLAPTHEEVICDLARKFVNSYKDLPQIWYQIQTKFRDETRPRSGVIRTRQFIMKDSYTLDTDEDALKKGYEKHAGAYEAIFSRIGVRFYKVGASSGLMGGSRSEEFMVESEFGEDSLVLCDKCDYAANLEVAQSVPEKVGGKVSKLEEIHTPGQRTIEEVSAFLSKQPKDLMKTLLYMTGDEPLMVLIRGDHDVNEEKLQAFLKGTVRPAEPSEVTPICGAEVGFVGPVGMQKQIRIIADETLKDQHNLTTGANKNDYHLMGIELERDLNIEAFADLRNVRAAETCTVCGGTIRIVNAIELGHIFQLGTKYSESMKATYLDHDGKAHPIVMGSYGIGVERLLACYIEQNNDERGIVWNYILAPYDLHLIPINLDTEEIRKTAETLYQTAYNSGLTVLMDDRSLSPGFKFKDADLLGIPLQVIIGKSWLESQQLEFKERKTGERHHVAPDAFVDTAKNILSRL